MKTNLISKIGKFAMAPIIAFSLNSGIKAQEKKFNLNWNSSVETFYFDYRKKLTPPEDWRGNFWPKLHSSSYEKKSLETQIDFKTEIEPEFDLGKLRIGFPVGIGLSNFMKYKPQELVIGNKDSNLALKDVTLKKKSPEFGLSTSVEVGEKRVISFSAKTYQYRIEERDFKSSNNWGGYVSESEPFNKTKIGNGWAQKFSLGTHDKYWEEQKEGIPSFEIFYERNGKINNTFGVSFRGTINLRKK